MTAQLIRFPIVARPVPLEHNAIYRRGVSDFLAAILQQRHGYASDYAKCEAERLTAMTLDQMPQNFGEGEAS